MKKPARSKSVKETRTAYQTTSRRTPKSDVSIPAAVRSAAQQLALQLNVSLSELYTTALTTYITEHQTTKTNDRRQAGSARGLIVMADDFDTPLSDFAEYES